MKALSLRFSPITVLILNAVNKFPQRARIGLKINRETTAPAEPSHSAVAAAYRNGHLLYFRAAVFRRQKQQFGDLKPCEVSLYKRQDIIEQSVQLGYIKLSRFGDDRLYQSLSICLQRA